jgi:hypothetical protein
MSQESGIEMDFDTLNDDGFIDVCDHVGVPASCIFSDLEKVDSKDIVLRVYCLLQHVSKTKKTSKFTWSIMINIVFLHFV